MPEPAPGAPDTPSPHAPQSTILIVEDSLIQGIVLRDLLRDNGYATSIARDGRQGLEAARELNPDLIISDVEMPHMNGYELCGTVKADPALRHIPLILLTTLSGSYNLLRALHAKADYYLTKPYNNAFLLSRIRTVLESRVPGNDGSRDEIEVDGERFRLDDGLDRHHLMNFLLCTYENAVQQNDELTAMQRELQALNQQLREQAIQLESLARLDGLTGLKNHRSFKERLSEEVNRTLRYQQPLSLLLVDIDHFKGYNDSFGHPAGDEVIRGVARLLAEKARTSDFVARYGGEEFALLLPNTNRDAAFLFAERLREAVASHEWPLRSVTVSSGIATLAPGSEEARTHDAAQNLHYADTLLARADEALYHSKKTGRNRTTAVGWPQA